MNYEQSTYETRNVKTPLEELLCLVQQACGSSRRTNQTDLFQRTEQAVLFCWAKHRKRFISYGKFARTLTETYESHEGGDEHDTFTSIKDSHGIIFKLTKPNNGYGARTNLKDYLENLWFSNYIFYDSIDVVSIIGRQKKINKLAKIFISQPLVDGQPASVAEIERYMKSLGFIYEGRNVYKHPCGTKIVDARPDNVFISATKEVFPIDVQILHGDRFIHLQLLYLLKSRYRVPQ